MSKIVKRFDEVFDLSLGRTPSRGVNSYWNGNHTWVSIADMSCGKYISSTKECITDKAISETGIPLVKKGTVIMSFKLSIGKVCITDVDLFTNEAIMAFTPKRGYTILPEYLYYYLMNYKWNNSNEVVLGFTLNKKTISQSIVSIPSSLPEQQRIVEFLDTEFAKIDALKANAEKNLQHAKDLFQAALREELQPKEGWTETNMGHVCSLSQGLAINAQTKHLIVKKSTLPLLRIRDLKENTGEIFVDEAKCPESCRVFPDEIIYTRTGTLGLIFTGFYGVMHNNCFKIILDNRLVTKNYIMYYLQSNQFKNNIISLAKRAAQPDITHKLFKEQYITFPPLSEQADIVSRLDAISERCNALQANYTKTIALCDDMKQALLRKAFSGEL